jgi:hypothetical protein
MHVTDAQLMLMLIRERQDALRRAAEGCRRPEKAADAHGVRVRLRRLRRGLRPVPTAR